MGQAYHREWVTKIIYLAVEEVAMGSLRKASSRGYKRKTLTGVGRSVRDCSLV